MQIKLYSLHYVLYWDRERREELDEKNASERNTASYFSIVSSDAPFDPAANVINGKALQYIVVLSVL
jgi:hypothetical protein